MTFFFFLYKNILGLHLLGNTISFILKAALVLISLFHNNSGGAVHYVPTLEDFKVHITQQQKTILTFTFLECGD